MALAEKKILIVGGSSGIGLATAQAAVAAGARVMITGRSPEKLAQARALLGNVVETAAFDMTQEQEVQAFFEGQHRTYDHLVISSASPSSGPFLQVEPARARQLFDIKFWGEYSIARYGAPKVAPQGSLTFVSGVVAFKAMKGSAPLAAVNAAIVSLAQTLALELAPVRVNVVSPGIIDTPARAGMPEQTRRTFYHNIAQQLPVQKVGEAEEVAQGIVFLMDNPFTTGTVLHVDGGHRLV
jgi:NAD(P)-dependent dehydrogenase (short-subunit alcohol dehydrogenase family)